MQFADRDLQQYLDNRRLLIRDPLACFFASVAIAGAACVQRTTRYSLDTALTLLEAGTNSIELTRVFGLWAVRYRP